jgi:uncharacterized membrane protein YhaH (DUF805 family)
MSDAQIVFGRRAGFSPAAGAAVEAPEPVSRLDQTLDLFLSPKGRMDRGAYLAARLGKTLTLGLLLVATKLATLAIDGGVWHRGDALNYVPLLLLSAWIDMALQIKRRHDLDQDWRSVWVGFVPVVGWFWVWIVCAFKEGTPGPNRFGDPAR